MARYWERQEGGRWLEGSGPLVTKTGRVLTEQDIDKLAAQEEQSYRRDEFEAAYAARSGVTVELLHFWGRWAEPCGCDDPTCEGWAMGHQWEDAIMEDRLRR